MKVVPVTGKLTQNIHLQVKNSEKMPPRMGPMPPARAHIVSSMPKANARLLNPSQSPRVSQRATLTHRILNMSDKVM